VHSYRYRITIEGHLGKAGCAAFEEFSIASGNGHTSLVADLDQSALLRCADPHPVAGLELRELARIPGDGG